MASLIVGYGYVGSALGELLRQAGESVFALSRSSRALPPGVAAIRADVTRPLELPSEIQRIAYVVSPDDSSPEAYERAYSTGIDRVLAAAPNAQVILTTSTAVYSVDDGSWVDEATPTSPSGNAAYLLRGEERVLARGGTVLRLAGIYGPERNRIVRQVHEKTATLSSTPRYANRIHRLDCASAIQHLFDRDPGVYLGVDDDPADLSDTYRWIAAELGVEAPALGDTDPRRGGNKRCSNRRLRRTGWEPRYPSYREGYREAIDAILQR